jgi:hypothetical protein
MIGANQSKTKKNYLARSYCSVFKDQKRLRSASCVNQFIMFLKRCQPFFCLVASASVVFGVSPRATRRQYTGPDPARQSLSFTLCRFLLQMIQLFVPKGFFVFAFD